MVKNISSLRLSARVILKVPFKFCPSPVSFNFQFPKIRLMQIFNLQEQFPFKKHLQCNFCRNCNCAFYKFQKKQEKSVQSFFKFDLLSFVFLFRLPSIKMKKICSYRLIHITQMQFSIKMQRPIGLFSYSTMQPSVAVCRIIIS